MIVSVPKTKIAALTTFTGNYTTGEHVFKLFEFTSIKIFEEAFRPLKL